MKETLQEMAERVAEERCGRGCGGCPAESWRDGNGRCLIRRLAKIKNAEEQIQNLKIWANTNPKTPELKPCPFCGCDVYFDEAYSYFRDSVIYCPNCDMIFTLDNLDADSDKITEAWSRRKNNGTIY